MKKEQLLVKINISQLIQVVGVFVLCDGGFIW